MRAAFLFLAVGAAAAQAQTYYYTDNFTSYNAGAWTTPGAVSFGASGLTSNGASWAGDKMYAFNNGGNSYRCEIKATFSSLPAGAWYNGSTDLWLGPYKLAFQAGYFTVYQVLGGSQYTLSAFGFSYTGVTTVRAILTTSGVRVVIGSEVFWTSTSGYPGNQGVGFTLASAGSAITQAQLAAGDTTAPNNVTGLSGQGTPMQVVLNWSGASDNAGGSGLLRYNLYRNGVLIASTFGTTYTDNAVSPATTYTYTVKSEDYHANEASGATVAVQTGTSGNAPDPDAPRQTGVRPLGSYWGGAGENIDMRSGNLSFSLPLLKAQGRHGASLGLSLSYNSQNWRRQNGGIPQKLGVDVGYGFGWKLQAGSVFQVNSAPGVISHYIFTDSTGAEFRLDVNDGGYWWGKEGAYVAYDPGLARLRFMDGTFWEMGSTSATSEPDSGTRYPTKVQDSNGNYISLEYQPGLGQGVVNTSARISTIKDIRSAPGNAYTFSYVTYQNETIPHLTGIATALPTGENYTLNYALAASNDPFTGSPRGNDRLLQSLSVNALPLSHTFEYGGNGAGELTKVIFPYKGELRWAHGDSIAYSNGQKLREVKYRYLVKQFGAPATGYTLEYDTDTTVPMHRYGLVKDPNGISQKLWYFYLNDSASPYYGLLQVLQEWVQGTGAIPRQTWPGYARDAAPHFNRYISSMDVQLDPQAAYTKTMRTEQTLDIYGNVTISKVFDFGNTTTPRTHHVFSYLNTPAYAQRFIFNRQTSASLSINGSLTPLSVASYDSYPGGLTARSGLDLHDSYNYGASFVTRGNRTGGGIVNGYSFASGYDMTGFATTGQNGNTTTAATPDAKNVVATTITPNGDPTKAMSASFNSIYQMNSAAGPNGASTSIGYDANARPANSTGPHGAYTTFTYDDINRWKMASTNGRWVKTYFDGFGRTIKEQSGNGANIVSTVDTEYDSCGCSPIGKMKRVSRPYVTGPPTNWTTYSYDSQGRVVSVVAPDGVSTTSYLYQGNTTKVTSPSLKWKIHEVDVVGNLTKVTEPNPAGGADFVTNYIYNDKNQLLTVSMPRPTGTQTRTFTYDSNGKVVTATNPETGTVTNTYDAATGLLQQKVDAKNNKVTYTYDSYKRVTEIRRYEWVAGAYVERAEQATRFYYDFNGDAGFGATNLAGRLAYVDTYSKRGGAAWNAPGGGNAWETMTFREMYSYTTAGLMTKKRFLAAGRYSPAYAVATDFLESSYTFDNEGRMTGQTYPAAHNLLDTTEVPGTSYTYGFDAMGRPKTMTQGGTSTFQLKDEPGGDAGITGTK